MKRLLAGAVALSLSTAVLAATPVFDPARISADVRELSSDAYEGRSPATEGERRTIAYLSAALAESFETGDERGWGSVDVQHQTTVEKRSGPD